MQIAENTNEWVTWIEEAVTKEYYRFYEHKHFSNIQKVGTGRFGKVYRTNWKISGKCLILKSFFNLDQVAKEVVRELKLHRDIQSNNIIKFHGIAKFDPGNLNFLSNNYLLVMEYADSGTLKNYLKENFNKLTWNDKFNLAYQLACAVSCLHNEEITHRDLHPSNILINQNTIKLSNFGISKRIEKSFNVQSNSLEIIPYVDPKGFSGRRKNKNSTRTHQLCEKSDIYSIGVLLWEISSGKPPFYIEGEPYDVDLVFEISQGLREEPIPNTPDDYVRIYTECWDAEPENRPNINQVAERLKAIIERSSVMTTINNTPLNRVNGELSQVIQQIDKINMSEKNLSKIVNDIVKYVFQMANEGKESKTVKFILDYFINNNLNPKEIYNRLVINQNSSDYIFLLGYFYYLGIETDKNEKLAYDLFISLSEQDYALAQYYAGLCYEFGRGTEKDGKMAFKYYEKVANKGHASGMFKIGYFYKHGIGVGFDKQKTIELYERAADLGNCAAQNNLAIMYKNGDGVDKDYVKAFELYHKAAHLGDSIAQFNIAVMYENGDGVVKDLNQALHWYEKSSKQGFQRAQDKLMVLKFY